MQHALIKHNQMCRRSGISTHSSLDRDQGHLGPQNQHISHQRIMVPPHRTRDKMKICCSGARLDSKSPYKWPSHSVPVSVRILTLTCHRGWWYRKDPLHPISEIGYFSLHFCLFVVCIFSCIKARIFVQIHCRVFLPHGAQPEPCTRDMLR